jgi:site-specific DNA recombinase
MSWALYLRQSVRREDSDLSVETQRERCRSLLPKGARATEYVDYESGARTDRPRYQAMLAEIEAGRVQGVAAWEISRLGRSASELTRLIEVLEARELPLLLVNGLSAQSAGDYRLVKSMLNMAAVVAQMERDQIRYRNRDVRRSVSARGRWGGGPPPFGYRYDRQRKVLAVTTDEAAVIAEMFRLFLAEGLTARQIAGRLTEAGHRTRAGTPWSSDTVLSHLRNPVYMGATVSGRYKVDQSGRQVAAPTGDWSWAEGTHGALVSREEWGRAQEIAASRSGRHRIRRYPPRPFSTVARCGLCGGTVVVQGGGRRRDGTSYPYYVCRRYAKTGKQACLGVRYTAGLLDDALVGAIDENCRRARDVLNGVSRLQPTSAPKESPRRRIAAFRRRIDREVWLFRQGAITERQFRSAQRRIESEIASIDEEVHRPKPEVPKDFASFWDRATVYQRRLLAVELVEAVVLHPDRIEVRFHDLGLSRWRRQETIPRPRRPGRGG